MYYPCLRGRKHELGAIRATTAQMQQSSKIVPVIEPVNENLKPVDVAARQVLGAKVPLVILTNPQVGELVGGPDPLQSQALNSLLTLGNLVPGYIVSTDTSVSEMTAFLKRYKNRRVCVIHAATPAAAFTTVLAAHQPGILQIFSRAVGAKYRSTLQGDLVALDDSFNRVPRNASYPADEFFSDEHQTFASGKLHGFSDYSVVGDYFKESGGPAHAVAIHLHHEEADGLWIKHFLSDRVTGPTDTAGKFAEAVAKLDKYAAKNPKVASTEACKEFRGYHKAGHFPGLGMVKELSIRHHIELLAAIL